MKTFSRSIFCLALGLIVLSNSGFKKNNIMADPLRGAWMLQGGSEEQLLIFVDGYNSHTVYSKTGKKFVGTRGGTYTTNDAKLTVVSEFDTWDKEQTGKSIAYNF